MPNNFQDCRFILVAGKQHEAKTVAALKQLVQQHAVEAYISPFRVVLVDDQEAVSKRRSGQGIYQVDNGKVVAVAERGDIEGLGNFL